MNQRDVDPAALVGQIGLSDVRPEDTMEPLKGSMSEEPETELEDLLDYSPVPLRHGETRLLHFRRGSRLRPLP
jgi:hypothetical protein